MKQPAFRTLIYTMVASLALSPMSSWAGLTIAQQPLSVAAPVAPNIMFILDDSGSMGWEHMPGTKADWSDDPVAGLPKTVSVNDIRLRAANINSMWYNPLLEYAPWLKYDGSSYPNADYDGGSVAADPSGKSGTGTLNFKTQFTAWKTLETGSGTSGVGNTEEMSTSTGMVSSNYRWRYSGFYYRTGSSATNVQHYKRYDFIYGCASGSSCTSAQKTWRAREVTLKTNGTDNSDVQLTEFDWTPYGGIKRSVTEELQNYANWFSYYRLRITMAKAAASRVFSKLGTGYRVGYNTIHDRQNFPIPVGQDDGLFTNQSFTTDETTCTGWWNQTCTTVSINSNNRKDWFDKLFTSISSSGTPLHASLKRTGDYFSEDGASGPYGPGTGAAQVTCRQNFAILTTDGYWNGKPSGSTGYMANNDNTNGTEYTDTKGKKYRYSPESPYKDSVSGTLADVAMYYWKRDLRDNLLNNVPTTGKSPAFWQHMRTYGISIGEKGTLTPNQETLDKIKAGTLSWPAPANDTQANIDDLWHAAVNSRGEFMVASNPDEFARALTNTLSEIANETKSEASGGTNSAELKAGTKTYFSRYTSGSWNGDIIAYPVDATTGLQNQSTPSWEAEKKLPAWNERKIYVNVSGTAEEFLYSKLNATQKTHLSADLVDYLRGDRSKEMDKTGGTLRERAGVLPAFINSQLVHVGAPEKTDYYSKLAFTGASDYAAYATAKKSRTPVIYIAGNNGMLHAFNANTGVEIYAFLPTSSVSAKLKDYADKDYGSNQTTVKPHQYILDGEISVADAYLDGAWKTILVGTQGRGGSGIFALDVTDPSDIKFLWEKSAVDNSALGNNLGKPVIAQVAVGDWRVILGNGPNSNGDKAQLLLFNLKTGAITAVDTGAGTNNGLAAVNAWDSDHDGFSDTAYAGDLEGNVWRFRNLAGSPTSAKLFAGSGDQPITAQPLVIKNQKTGATWVTVGSGQYLNKDDLDKTKFKTQTWYGLLDTGSAITARSQLKQRKLLSSGAASGIAGRTLEAGSESEIIADGLRGWYIDFDLPKDNGERMMTPNFILGGALFGISFTPDASDPCQPNGTSSIWAINPFSGGRINQGIFDINGDGSFNDSDKIGSLYPSVLDGIPAVTSGSPPITGSGKDGTFSIHLPTTDIKGKTPVGQPARQSWREVVAQ